jgi:hypothetical protein
MSAPRLLFVACSFLAAVACGALPPPTASLADAGEPAATFGKAPAQGVVSRSQATRSGVDATRDCVARLPEIKSLLAARGSVAVQASYLTDFDGMLAWGREMRGQTLVGELPASTGRSDVIACWVGGDFDVDTRNFSEELTSARGSSAVVQFDVADAESALVTLTAQHQIGVVAPPAPSEMSAAERSSRSATHPQPSGVTVTGD